MGLIDAVVPGAGLLGAGINAWATSANNRKQRNWNWRMYQQQRADSLSDYHMQNEYNSPAAQMARFKEANLNPNLIYGQTNSAAPVRSTDADSYRPEAPQVDLQGIARDSLAAYYDAQAKPLQVDNLKKAVEIASEQVRLTQAQTAAALAQGRSLSTGADKNEFDLGIAKALRSVTIDQAEANLSKTQVDTMYTMQAQRAAMESKTMEEATARIRTMELQNANTQAEKKNIEQRLRLLQQDERIKKFDEEMLRQGARPGDALWERKLMEILTLVWDEVNGNSGRASPAQREAWKKKPPVSAEQWRKFAPPR